MKKATCTFYYVHAGFCSFIPERNEEYQHSILFVDRIRNIQIQTLQTVFICLLALPFYAFFIFDSNATDVTFFTMT